MLNLCNERLLSLSKDVNNPKWKPLNMSAGLNSRNRRVAKQRTKNNWYKGKTEVEPPTPPEMKAKGFSIHREQGEHPIQEEAGHAEQSSPCDGYSAKTEQPAG